MRRRDFHYHLPKELIAQQPPEIRGASRLLHLDGVALHDLYFQQLPDLIEAADLLVLNDTKVIPARLFGHKESGGQVEILIERILNDTTALAHIRASRSPMPSSRLILESGLDIEVVGRADMLFKLRFPQPVLTVLKLYGSTPLPPYIEREATQDDAVRYQTIYARREGAVAAPTAGLHFNEELLSVLAHKGIKIAYVTLHVGAGTFQPVRADDIREHVMHSEYLEISTEVCTAIEETRARGGRVVAVGTTVVRSLEAAAHSGELIPYRGETDIFIYPGYRFRIVDALITNFHLPESTLLMLVCAFAGYEEAMAAYRHAVRERYRFFSYGDAMLILPRP